MAKYFLLFLFVIINIFQIIYTNITYDESYYWIYSKFLDVGYYDHPPFVALLIYVGEVFGHGPFFTRLLFFICGLLSLFLVLKMTKKSNHLLAITLFFSFPLLSSSTIFALPDTPLLLFSLLLWYLTPRYVENNSFKYCFLISLTIACLFYSKYHGLLVVIFTSLSYPAIYKRKSFWLIVLMSITFYLPHLYWQYKNDYISFVFHLTGRSFTGFDISNVYNFIFGAIFSCGFLVFIFSFKYKNSAENLNIYKYNYKYFLIFIFILSFRNQIEINWIVTASCAFLIYLLSREYTEFERRKILLLALPNLVLMFLFRIVLINDFGLRDKAARLNEIHGWQERFEVYESLNLRGPVIFETYQWGALFSYHYNQVQLVHHYRGRQSQFTLLDLVNKSKIGDDEVVNYVSTKKSKIAYKIDTNFRDPIYIYRDIKLKDLKKKFEK